MKILHFAAFGLAVGEECAPNASFLKEAFDEKCETYNFFEINQVKLKTQIVHFCA